MFVDTLLLGAIVVVLLIFLAIMEVSVLSVFDAKHGRDWIGAAIVAIVITLALGRLFHPLRMAHARPDAGQESPEDPRHSRRRHAGDDP